MKNRFVSLLGVLIGFLFLLPAIRQNTLSLPNPHQVINAELKNIALLQSHPAYLRRLEKMPIDEKVIGYFLFHKETLSDKQFKALQNPSFLKEACFLDKFALPVSQDDNQTLSTINKKLLHILATEAFLHSRQRRIGRNILDDDHYYRVCETITNKLNQWNPASAFSKEDVQQTLLTLATISQMVKENAPPHITKLFESLINQQLEQLQLHRNNTTPSSPEFYSNSSQEVYT